MENAYNTLAAHYSWWSENKYSASKLDPKLAAIVCEKGSLTAALVALSDNNFAVNVIEQRLAIPHFHEQNKLDRPLGRAAMIREVELQLFGESVVFARSIIPFSLLTKGRNGLANLGRTPLGHLLFKDGRMRVSKRDFSNVQHQCGTVTARRTPYDYQGSQILVSEFFLPAIFQYL